jgi:drug/metabolite transporter (DMT)-like permease
MATDILFPPLPAARPDSRTGAYVAYAAICVIWGTTFVAIRIAIETMPTLLVNGLRFVSAGLILLFIAGLTGARFPRRAHEWRAQIISGILMSAAGNSLVVYSEHVLSSGLTALLLATIPIWMALIEAVLGLSTLSRRKAIGLALGFGGVGLLVAPAIGRPELSLPFFLAVGATQLSAVCWNSGTLFSRRHPSTSDAMANAVVQMLAGGIAVVSVALITGQRPTLAMFSVRSTFALAYLAVFGSVIAYTAYNYALSKLSAGKVSSYAYVNPLVAVIVGAMVLQEAVTLRMICAMVVILGGVAVIQIDRSRIAVRRPQESR